MVMSKYEHGDAAEGAKTPERQGNANGQRILIVEDDRLSMTLLSDFLNAHGFRILKTSEGWEAINLARDEQPDLILMDIRLPNISGFDVTRVLKQVTAFATPGDETTALESGCAAYITKPVKVDELLRIIRSFLSACLPQ